MTSLFLLHHLPFTLVALSTQHTSALSFKQKNFHISRKVAVIVSCALALGVGVFIEAEPKVGAWMDFVSIIITPLGAVLGAISVYYILGWDEIRKELEEGHGKLSDIFGVAAKYLYVPLTVIIMVLGLIYGGI